MSIVTMKHPGGRPPGSRNKATIARELGFGDACDEIAEAGMSPLSLLLRVARGDTTITKAQIQAAEILLPYFHARLSPKQPDAPAEDLEETARELRLRLLAMEATIGGGGDDPEG